MAKDCNLTSVGTLLPISDLAMGGVYNWPNGPTNSRPQKLLDLYEGVLPNIYPRLPDGTRDDANGVIVIAGMGMSNCKRILLKWIADVGLPASFSAKVKLINLASGGECLPELGDPGDNYWTAGATGHKFQQLIAESGYTAEQVQIVIMPETAGDAYLGNPPPYPTLEEHQAKMVQDIWSCSAQIKDHLPNVQTVIYSPRVYGGYCPTSKSPDSVKYPLCWATQHGIRGASHMLLNGEPAWQPSDTFPLVDYGADIWSQGPTPNPSGYCTLCDDLIDDGVHPSDAGQTKLANAHNAWLLASPLAAALTAV